MGGLPGQAKWYGYDPSDYEPPPPPATAAQLRRLLVAMEAARIRPSAQQGFVEKHLGYPRPMARLTADEVQKLCAALSTVLGGS
jgi:hypothetical protein